MIRLITSLATLLVVSPAINAETISRQAPRLVVGITVDQLRGDYLELFQSSFGERGFKRLFAEGLVYNNLSFDFSNVNAASSIASIYTGTNPSYHGIIDSKVYRIDEDEIQAIYADGNYMGNYTQDKVSPKALKANTITDELKLASEGNSKVYSFAPNFEQAISTASKTADCAFWIDSYTGKWASSTFYKDFHWTVDAENRNHNSHAIQVWGKSWKPLYDRSHYNASIYGDTNAFQHMLGADKNTYILYKQTPLVNDAVVNMASIVMDKAAMGKSVNPDFLSISLNLGAYPGISEYSIETQDSYVRLDNAIADLLDNIEQAVGFKNTLIFISSTGYSNRTRIGRENIELEENIFYPERCQALLNMYLMAIYGRDHQWVKKYHNGQIYLDQKLIKDKDIDLREIQTKAAEFVQEFSGVHNVYTSSQVNNASWSPSLELYKNGIYQKNTSDLFIEFEPGIQIGEQKTGNEYKKIVSCPVIFFGNGIKAQRIRRGIKAEHIAPSVCYRLRIRAPDASATEVLPELML